MTSGTYPVQLEPFLARGRHWSRAGSCASDIPDRTRRRRRSSGRDCSVHVALRLGSRRALLPLGRSSPRPRLRRLSAPDRGRRLAGRQARAGLAGRSAHGQPRRGRGDGDPGRVHRPRAGRWAQSAVDCGAWLGRLPRTSSGSASIFHPTWLDALAWTSFLYVAVRLLVRREPRLWLLLGLIAGIGLEAKYTIAFLIAGVRRRAHPATAERRPAAQRVAVAGAGDRHCAACPEPGLAGAARLAKRPLLLKPKRPDRLGHLTPGVHRRAAAVPRARPSVLAVPASYGYGDAGCARWRSFRFSSRRSSSSSAAAATTPSRRTRSPSPRERLRSTDGCEPGRGWRSSRADSRFRQR